VVPVGHTVNAKYYRPFLEYHLRLVVQWKCLHFITGASPLVLHDSARCHVARPVQDLLAQWQWETVEHPPYSLDMSPCDFDLFPKMKEPLRGKRFRSVEEVMQAVGWSLATINRNRSADGIRRLPQIWDKVDYMLGDYIEGM
jgi:hypothetical protein